MMNWMRSDFAQKSGLVATEHASGLDSKATYYSFVERAGATAWRFIVLDPFDLSIYGWPTNHPSYLAARKLLTGSFTAVTRSLSSEAVFASLKTFRTILLRMGHMNCNRK